MRTVSPLLYFMRSRHTRNTSKPYIHSDQKGKKFKYGGGKHITPLRTNSIEISPSEINYTQVLAQSLPLFSETGMVFIRMYPTRFRYTPERKFIAAAPGHLRFTFYAPTTNASSLRKFDTSKSIQCVLRGVDIGLLLETDAQRLESPLIHQGPYGALEVFYDTCFSPSDTEDPQKPSIKKQLVLRGRSGRPATYGPQCVDVRISTGTFCTLQTLIKHAAPSLFGWQVLLDPTLATTYIDPAVLQQLIKDHENQQEQEAVENFFI